MVDQFGIHLGPLYVRFYALIILTGAVIAGQFIASRAEKQQQNPQHVWNGILWVMIPAVIGARIYHILTPTPASGLTIEYYLQNPLQMLAIWNGGLGIYGAIIGGVLGFWLYAKKHRLSLITWFDLAAPGLLLAQAIGRWGNFVNQELYGAPTTLPWAIQIPPEKRLPGYEQYSTFHPLFLYESVWNLASMGIMLWVERRYRNHLKQGDMVLLYLFFYPIGRFLLDFVRLDSNGFGFITTAQLVSLITCAIALTILLWRHRTVLSKTALATISTEAK